MVSVNKNLPGGERGIRTLGTIHPTCFACLLAFVYLVNLNNLIALVEFLVEFALWQYCTSK